MKERDDDTIIIVHLSEGKGLRLVPVEKRESLLPDPKLETLIEEMKERQKPKRLRLKFYEGPEAA